MRIRRRQHPEESYRRNEFEANLFLNHKIVRILSSITNTTKVNSWSVKTMTIYGVSVQVSVQ